MRRIQAGCLSALAAVSLWSIPATADVGPGQQARFTATAYCDSGVTKSGVRTRRGIIAADPAHLPVGSVVRVRDAGHPRYEGIYTVMDTGSLVRGRRIDVYIPDCREAREFGLRRKVLVRVLRLGWNPEASMAPADAGAHGPMP